MKKVNNIVHFQTLRQLDHRYNPIIQEKLIVTPNLIKRLGLFAELDGHTGCINCLEWSSDGKILASGSDDVQVVLWDPFRKKKLTTIRTGHTGNIFTVKFLPNTENRTIVSGAADYAVKIHDVISGDVIGVCTCHTNRVKRCVTDPLSPNLFWSAGEDGLVIQHDMRTLHNCPSPETSTGRDVLIDLRQFIGKGAEAKCLAINPIKTELFAVGANDPYVRLYDRRIIRKTERFWYNEEDTNAVQYFVPGHLPSKLVEYKKKYRSLASTFVTFSPDGKELLVNLGGEQIYLFPINGNWQSEVCNLVVPDIKGCINGVKELETGGSNVFSNGFKNGTTSTIQPPSVKLDFSRGMRRTYKPNGKVVLPPAAEEFKRTANKAFEEKKYAKAVHFYNEGLSICPSSSVLYGNRSAALLKRGWDGDVYAAYKDCQIAVCFDHNHYKALLRMSRCLFDMDRTAEAAECFRQFKYRFPEHTKTELCLSLEKEIQKLFSPSQLSDLHISALQMELRALLKPPISSMSDSGSSSSAQTSSPNLNSSSSMSEGYETTTPESVDTDTSDDNNEIDTSEVASNRNFFLRSPPSSDSSSSFITSTQFSAINQRSSKPIPSKRAELYVIEHAFRDRAVDFRDRFCGHCNTTTDIKEANYFGNYIVAGSDDGSFFIWDRKTTNIVKIIKGDESIVNCLQPHPSTCMLATSGIESVCRIWAPMSEEGFVNDRVVEDINDAAYANQKRMNSNPFEVILMNMGYRLSSGAEEEGSEDDAAQEDGPIQMPCNPS